MAAIDASAAKVSGSSSISGQPAEAVLEPLGNRHLSNHTPKDQLPGGIEKPVRQGVDDVIPGAGLGLVERLGRLGAAPAGHQGHKRKIGCGASRHDADDPTPSGPKPEKPGAQPIERTASERNFTQPRKKCTLAKENRPAPECSAADIFLLRPPPVVPVPERNGDATDGRRPGPAWPPA